MNRDMGKKKVGLWKLGTAKIAAAKEQTRIYQARNGIWSGEDAWVDEGMERGVPLPLPKGLEPATLGGAELRVAVRLGYLNLETMTREQLAAYKKATDPNAASAARGFVERLRLPQVHRSA
jgi:hypothetical protein